MGTEIQQDRFDERDYVRFRQRLRENLGALDEILRRPGFGEGERTLGAEVEFFLVDREARPLRLGQEVARESRSSFITPEMGACDVELSTPPVALAGRPFSALRDHIEATLALIRRRAEAHDARVVPISVLPTFRRSDFRSGAITDLPRYRALAAGLRRLRDAPFHICIDGEDPLDLMSDDPAMEGANTAFQVHLRASAAEFANVFNAASMLTGPILAAAGNSPTFLGHRLWQETRVALFKQAGDDRPPGADEDWRRPSRINFGHGWVRQGAAELFRESVALHEPLLPVCSPSSQHDQGDQHDQHEDDGQGGGACPSRASAPAAPVPTLDELRLHHGTVWTWNRPVYDPTGAGHLRVELRALPSGPTVDDMLANAAFLVGAILDLAPEMPDRLPSFPFPLAERNFYRAAQLGLDAELAWPAATGQGPVSTPARAVLASLLPRAEAGLRAAGVASDDVRYFLGLFEARVASGVTGAVWQQRTLAALEGAGVERDRALAGMLERYIVNVESGQPVHTWSVDD